MFTITEAAPDVTATQVTRIDEGGRICQQVILDASTDSVIEVRSSRTDPDIEVMIPDGDTWLHIRATREEGDALVATLTAALGEPATAHTSR